MSLICCFRYGISSGASLMTTVSPFFAEEFTFFWRAALADYIIHMGFAHAAHHTINFLRLFYHTIPAFFREYSETKACRTVFLEFDEKFEITYPIGVSKI